MSNVILFPKAKKGSPPITMEQLYENVEETRKEHIEYLIDDTLSFVFERCREEGFDLSGEHCLKTTTMLIEAFRAGLYKSVDIDHPLHAIASVMFIDQAEQITEKETEEEPKEA